MSEHRGAVDVEASGELENRAVVRSGHELACRKTTTLAQVARHPIVCMPTGTGLRAVLDQACAARSLRPTIVIQAAAADSIADLAARGLGVGILSSSRGFFGTPARARAGAMK
jgi:DNA-binding transcriptional LysR family regulator